MSTLYGPDGNPLKPDAEAPEGNAAQPAEVPAAEPARPPAPVPWWRVALPWLFPAILAGALTAAFWAVWTLDPDSAVSFGSTVVGLLLAWIGYTADRSGRLKFLGLSFVLLVLLGAQLIRNYSRTLLRFRESPQATTWVRLNVSHEVRAFRAHLDGIGLPTVEPAQVDMITAKGQGCGAATTTPEARRDVLMIPTAFPAGIRKGATCAYLGFIVLRLTRLPNLPPERLKPGRTLEDLDAEIAWDRAHPALDWRSLAIMALEEFLDASYWGERGAGGLPPWTEVLWDIRGQAGRQFTDRLAAETLVAVAEETAVEGWSSRENYVMEHLRTADSVIDSEQARWPMIRETLRRHGAFPREYPDAQ